MNHSGEESSDEFEKVVEESEGATQCILSCVLNHGWCANEPYFYTDC